jgi:hypothetical protein
MKRMGFTGREKEGQEKSHGMGEAVALIESR